ncbi:MAG: hypothetical protein FJY97_07060 [candidate division Zixibacteria bacterium]|nr:hypothetical protein [candidate division Zixibacteria bacterium]
MRIRKIASGLAVCLSALTLITTARAASPLSDSFGAYWFQGKAEITSYRLEQARYGEIHTGNAMLIFVTEDFSRSKQVKLDDYSAAGSDAVKVLKLNATRHFTTGIYPYTLMASVLSPIDPAEGPRPLKISMSAQEWCGQVFVQINLKDGAYRVRQYSYFESEGDRDLPLEAAIPEDEIWTTIRLDPSTLPVGPVRMIPGVMIQRLKHSPWKAVGAVAERRPDLAQPEIDVYTLTYPEMSRILTIRFRRAFPYEIESWEETYRDGFGSLAKELTTRATLMKRVMIDYWNRNHTADAELRRALGLE